MGNKSLHSSQKVYFNQENKTETVWYCFHIRKYIKLDTKWIRLKDLRWVIEADYITKWNKRTPARQVSWELIIRIEGIEHVHHHGWCLHSNKYPYIFYDILTIWTNSLALEEITHVIGGSRGGVGYGCCNPPFQISKIKECN